MAALCQTDPDLFKTYSQLDHDSKLIMQLAALINHHTYESFAAHILYKHKICCSDGSEFSVSKIGKILRSLRKQNLVFYSHDRFGCADNILHAVLKEAVAQEKLIALLPDAAHEYPGKDDYYGYSDDIYIARDLRLLIYQNKYADIKNYYDDFKQVPFIKRKWLWSYLTQKIPFDREWLCTLCGELQCEILQGWWLATWFCFAPCTEIMHFAVENASILGDGVHELLAEYYLLSADDDNFATQIKKVADPYVRSVLSADYLFCKNRFKEAIDEYQIAVKMLRKKLGKNKVFLISYHGVFYLFAALSHLGASETKRLLSGIKSAENVGINLSLFDNLTDYLQGVAIPSCRFTMSTKEDEEINSNCFLSIMVLFWLSRADIGKNLTELAEYFTVMAKNGYKVFAKICAEMITPFAGHSSQYAQYLERDAGKVTLKFLEIVEVKPLWELLLDRAANISNQEVATNDDQRQVDKRLVWFLDVETHHYLSDNMLKPALQERAVNGSWKKPRELSLKRFYEEPPQCMTGHDRKIYETLTARRYSDHPEWNISAALQALIGHPHIYDAQTRDCEIDLSEGKVSLLVTDRSDRFNIKLSQHSHDSEVKLVKETNCSFKVIKFNPALVRLAGILGKDGLDVPREGKDKLLQAIEKLANDLTVYSSVENQAIPSMPAIAKMEVQLMPYDDGLQAQIVVRPFGDFGEAQLPCEGSKVILAAHQGKKVQAVRNFDEEKYNFDQLCLSCKTLQENLDNYQAIFITPRECLRVLSELNNLENAITMVWPRGEMVQVKANLSFKNLKLRVKKTQDWFSVDGDVIVDDKKFMSIKELLDLIDYNSDPFIPLSTDKFISLSDHFKKQLQKLKNTALCGDGGYRIHKLAVSAIDDVFSDCNNVELDDEWGAQIAKLSDKVAIDSKIDVNLEPILRHYQVDGCNWLSKMAHFGMGACLADDMGLGKTVQAISILLAQAKDGPSLAIAPTSVCYNWVLEIKKFAQKLKPHLFAELDREALLKNVAAQDVVICSYGLLQRNINLLNKINWQVIILDEAQAIKNSTAKRTQAVYQLQGNFRLALTGTPIENHLGELWSLFRFLNPGFLGGEESFYKRFITPIEQHKNEYARNTLKSLIKPFILRRMKDAVLQDLPAKTELTVMVDLSTEERAFYEALRIKAIEQIENDESGLSEGQKRFKILAEITKLRLACCHSTLANGEIDLPSSKLEQFSYLLNDILENKHKVLVFSQFVRYLDLVKNLLEEKKISYQYLDGQTPQGQRKEIVGNFQGGKDSVFLLSLKAGGVGLNLTAADYVILLDPWWNPAVENQAADRAHRIGQTKPVTIYRLINKQTIEEKILELHQTKKDLANDLLNDSDASGKLNAAELLRMIKLGS